MMKSLLTYTLLALTLGITCFSNAANLSPYPIESPSSEGYLQVSEKHQIYYAAYGNPDGIPVVILHGGPGIGCSDSLTRFFDLNNWYVIMFDQRGAMRSKPFACMEENTTAHSISDIETLRKYFEIDKWVLFGGSWGSCLALSYGEAHPEACLGFILRGIFLGRDEDIRLFKDIETKSTEAYREFITNIPEEELDHLPEACYRRIMDPDPQAHMSMARAIISYMGQIDTPPAPPKKMEMVLKNDRFVLSQARALLHYLINGCFLEPNQILSRIDRIAHLPAILIHGSSDTVCFPEQARLLHANWDRSLLWMIDGAGHSTDDPAIASALVEATRAFAIKTFP